MAKRVQQIGEKGIFHLPVGVIEFKEPFLVVIILDGQVAGLVEQRQNGEVVDLIGAKGQFAYFARFQIGQVILLLFDQIDQESRCATFKR